MSFDEVTVRFNDAGLVPAVVRDAATGGILMVAWMNERSLALTIESGEIHFWSRSRGELWHKGATSGNRQRVVGMRADCDSDTLLIDVVPSGPACHTGSASCFGDRELERMDLARLMALLESRFRERPEGSYSTKLFDAGLDRILKKVGEEATEVVIAAKGESRERLVEETCDLLYHLAVLLVDKRVTLREVAEELAARDGRH